MKLNEFKSMMYNHVYRKPQFQCILQKLWRWIFFHQNCTWQGISYVSNLLDSNKLSKVEKKYEIEMMLECLVSNPSGTSEAKFFYEMM